MINMKIKIESREGHDGETLYDIYYGFTGIPTTFPFCTKWVLDKECVGLSKTGLCRWFEKNACGYRKIIIKL